MRPLPVALLLTTLLALASPRGIVMAEPAARPAIGDRQGGENIATSVGIWSLPFHGEGTTDGYADDYDEQCPDPSTSPDVVYFLENPESSRAITIDLCGSSYDTKVYVYVITQDPLDTLLVACNDNAECEGERSLQSRIDHLELEQGQTYYIVIDGGNGESGPYGVDVQEAPACVMGNVTHDWDFALGNQGFHAVDCDQGGIQVWEHGATTYIPDPPARVWGTILAGNYPNGSGAGLVSPPFFVDEQSWLVEVRHYLDCESWYDGANVSIGVWPNSQVIQPIGGYPGVISSDPGFYALCVDGEEGWTRPFGGWRTDCFDISPFLGQTVTLEFDFGSDESVTAAGWYLARVAVGAPPPQVRVCCLPWTGACELHTEYECAQIGGIFRPELVTCDPNPCPRPPFPVRLQVCGRSHAEPWHAYVPAVPDWGIPVRLLVPAGMFAPPGIAGVEFFYSHNLGASWDFLGADADGSESRMDTFDPTVHPAGDAWSIHAPCPQQLPEPGVPAVFKAVAFREGHPPLEFLSEVELDPRPPELARTNIEDWMVVPGDSLDLLVQSNGVMIDSILVFVVAKPDTFVKNVPGISQQPHSPSHCAPTAAAQCLKYFEDALGDTVVTGGLGNHALVDSLASPMGTNQGVQGTTLTGWEAGLAQWIAGHGNAYTIRMDLHFLADGTETWVVADWQTMRNELERGQDVLVGVFWPGGGGHAMTLNSIINTPLSNGCIQLDFKDPWTGLTETGELNTQTGHLYNLTGAGGGGTAYLGVTMYVCPFEPSIVEFLPIRPTYTGPVPDPPRAIPINIPDIGAAFVHVVIVNMAGHASALSAVVTRPGTATAPAASFAEALFLADPNPNPFVRRTTIGYGLPAPGPVHLAVFDVAGRRVRDLVEQVQSAGRQAITWDGLDGRGRPVAGGVYYVRLDAAGRELTRRVVLVR
jgi:hypothetical protein